MVGDLRLRLIEEKLTSLLTSTILQHEEEMRLVLEVKMYLPLAVLERRRSVYENKEFGT